MKREKNVSPEGKITITLKKIIGQLRKKYTKPYRQWRVFGS
jgi:hypothetical protein